MIWSSDAQIKIGSNDSPSSNASPVLASSGTRLYLVYSGTNQHVYWAWTDNKSGNYSDWQGDEPIKWAGLSVVQTSGGPPAAAFFAGFLVAITLAPLRDDLKCSIFDGNRWSGYNLQPLLGGAKYLLEVVALVAGGQLHVFATDAGMGSIHLVCTGTVTDIASWSVAGTPETAPKRTQSLGVIQGLLFRMSNLVHYQIPLYGRYAPAPGTGHYLPEEQQTGQIEAADGSPNVRSAVIFSWLDVTYVIYQTTGDVGIYSATFKTYVNGNMLLNPSVPVRTSSVTIKTNWPIAGMVTHEGRFFMAHKGNDNSRLYLAHGQ